MRLFTLLVMLIASPIVFAQTTINATIEKGKSFSTIYLHKKDLAEKKFAPAQHYTFEYLYIKKFALATSSDKSFNPGLYKAISFNITLDLLDYFKSTDSYKFKLTLGPGLTCNNEGKGPYRKIKTAKIYFADNNQESIILEGKFNRAHYLDRKDRIYEYPEFKIDESDARPFMLTAVKPNPDSPDLYMDELNPLFLTTQHDIPVIIKFD